MPELEETLDGINMFFSTVFLIEMIFKLVGLSPRAYARDKFNLFDGMVVCLWLVEVSASGSSALSALRAFRLLRIFKLLRSWTSLRLLLSMVMSSASDLLYFLLILILFLFSFAVMGMQLFGEMKVRCTFIFFFFPPLTIFVANRPHRECALISRTLACRC